MTSPYAKAALFLIRFSALGLIVLGLVFYAPDFFLYLAHRPISRPASLALKALPVLAGVALYGKSKGIAQYLTRDLD